MADMKALHVELLASIQHVCTCGVGGRLQARDAANATVQISFNNTTWFQIKGAKQKGAQAHLASPDTVNRWVHCRPVVVEEKMLMSTNTDKGTGGMGSVFLAGDPSKVAVMARNWGSGEQDGRVSVFASRPAPGWTAVLLCHEWNSWLTYAKMEDFHFVAGSFSRANYTSKCHNMILIPDLLPDGNRCRASLLPLIYFDGVKQGQGVPEFKKLNLKACVI